MSQTPSIKDRIVRFGRRWLKFTKRIPLLASLTAFLHRALYTKESTLLLRALNSGGPFDEFNATVCEELPIREGLNRLCDLSDWNNSDFQRLFAHIGERNRTHRKDWEYVRTAIGLEKLGVLKHDSVALSVGSGHENLMYYLTNRVRKVIGIDVYDSAQWPREGNPGVLIDPDKFAPFEYRSYRLELRRMNACDLGYDDETFDFAYSLSSIEHFGGHEKAALAMREMERTLKTGGVACVVTEFVINGRPHVAYFNRADLERFLLDSHSMELIDPPIDFRIQEKTLASYIDVEKDSLDQSPHVVLKRHGYLWTSIILFFQKG